jgi:uncharacterized protein
MTPCFADSSYYLAILVPEDVNHAAAQAIALHLRRPVVTSEFIILEVGNFLSAPKSRGKFAKFLGSLQRDPNTEIVRLSSDLLRRGVELYNARPDKAWSITDCVSFTIMQDRDLTDALTADHHFEQAGFVALLKSAT